MLDYNILTLLTYLDSLKKEYDADGVKVYFKSIDDFTVKIIKEEKIVKIFRKGRGQFDKLPEGESHAR